MLLAGTLSTRGKKFDTRIDSGQQFRQLHAHLTQHLRTVVCKRFMTQQPVDKVVTGLSQC